MTTTPEQAPSCHKTADDSDTPQQPFCPFSMRVECLDRMLNFEIVEHSVYSGLEIQGHVDGILVFLLRSDTNTTDVYLQPGLHFDETTKKLFSLGSGLGEWKENHEFDAATLQVDESGVHAHIDFQDVEGRRIYIQIDDDTPFNTAHRNMCSFLAPVGVTIEKPLALPMVYMKSFDLLTRKGGHAPIVTIDGQAVKIGSMPLERCMNKRLIKVAKDLVVVSINPSSDVESNTPSNIHQDDGGNITAITARRNDHQATMVFDPPFPNLAETWKNPTMPRAMTGMWQVGIDDDTRIISGTWKTALCNEENGDHNPTTSRDGHRTLQILLDVTKGWRPTGLPWLTKIITTVVPVFRIWPESYRWMGIVGHTDEGSKDDGSAFALHSSRWDRIGGERGKSYSTAFGG